MDIWVILLAAGQGSRLPEIKTRKQFLTWRQRPLFWHSARTFSRVPNIKGMVFVLPQEELADLEKRIPLLAQTDNLGLNYRIVTGGRSRSDSSFKGIRALPGPCTHVLIHDAARPLLSADCIQRVIACLEQGAVGVVPGLGLTETVKQVKQGRLSTLPRDSLYAVQTPQGFERKTLEEAHLQGQQQGVQVTDDASLLEQVGLQVELVPGDPGNVKITHARDLKLLEEPGPPQGRICLGWGYDVHRFGSGKPLKLGGIPISNGPHVLAHSDGDVLLHALIDAILGCLGQGDIGDHFPDTDPKFAGINSGILLQEVLNMARIRGLILDHLDLTIITQIPKISPWKMQIRKNLISLLNCDPGQLNLKATSEEGLGFTGEKKGIKAVAQVIGHFEKNASA